MDEIINSSGWKGICDETTHSTASNINKVSNDHPHRNLLETKSKAEKCVISSVWMLNDIIYRQTSSYHLCGPAKYTISLRGRDGFLIIFSSKNKSVNAHC